MLIKAGSKKRSCFNIPLWNSVNLCGTPCKFLIVCNTEIHGKAQRYTENNELKIPTFDTALFVDPPGFEPGLFRTKI
jgi:hypothetical protein